MLSKTSGLKGSLVHICVGSLLMTLAVDKSNNFSADTCLVQLTCAVVMYFRVSHTALIRSGEEGIPCKKNSNMRRSACNNTHMQVIVYWVTCCCAGISADGKLTA